MANDIALALKELHDFVGNDGSVLCLRARVALGRVVYTLARYEDALKLVLMLYSGAPWTDDFTTRWYRITGGQVANRDTMIEFIRCALTGDGRATETRQGPGHTNGEFTPTPTQDATTYRLAAEAVAPPRGIEEEGITMGDLKDPEREDALAAWRSTGLPDHIAWTCHSRSYEAGYRGGYAQATKDMASTTSLLAKRAAGEYGDHD